MAFESSQAVHDGIRSLIPKELLEPHVRRLRDFYEMVPGAPFYRREFGLWMCIDAWHERGLPKDADLNELFSYDPPASFGLGELGWCEAAFFPKFEERVLEDRGDCEVAQDYAGRRVLFFKGRRSGFMPEYLEHPVTDARSWEENVKWRLDPAAPGRFDSFPASLAKAKEAAGKGHRIVQNLIGGYMYLRSLIGPERLLYAFYDQPELIRDCMETWLKLADAVCAERQKELSFDEVFLAEDICYNHGPLISPEMIREFLIPYYQQLLANVKARQIDKLRPLTVQIDTDGFSDPVIGIYKEIGMGMLSPFEVASGCDVVRTAREEPWLLMSGGIDKRVLASTKGEIDRMLERILPDLRARGGYIPTCDHGVPPEVPLENYLHYRKRCLELGG